MYWRRPAPDQRHRGAILISAILLTAFSFSAITALMGSADGIAAAKNWQTTMLRGENAAAAASVISEKWLRARIASGELFAQEAFKDDSRQTAEPLTQVPNSVLEPLRAVTPYASIDAAVVDLNYADSYAQTAENDSTPRSAPFAVSLKNETGEITDYRAKLIQLKTTVTLPGARNAVFSRTETFLVLKSGDGSLRTIRLYSKRR